MRTASDNTMKEVRISATLSASVIRSMVQDHAVCVLLACILILILALITEAEGVSLTCRFISRIGCVHMRSTAVIEAATTEA